MKKEIYNYLFIVIGSAIMAFGVVGFLIPNKIATGGTTGLSIILHHVFGISLGILFGIINLPLILISIKFLGRYFALKTTIAILLVGLMIELFTKVITLEALSTDPILATLYGGVAVGTGLGFVFKGGGSAGGGTIIARIVAARTRYKTGSIILIIDAFVVATAAIVFKSVELALWSMISIYTATKMIDVILTGRSSKKIIHIVSYKELSPLGIIIKDKIGVTGTIIKGKDLGLNDNKDIIFVTVANNRLNVLKQLVKVYDKDAKMIVMEASEMLGSAVLSK